MLVGGMRLFLIKGEGPRVEPQVGDGRRVGCCFPKVERWVRIGGEWLGVGGEGSGANEGGGAVDFVPNVGLRGAGSVLQVCT